MRIDIIKMLLPSSDTETLKEVVYCHTPNYKRYFSNAIDSEKKILIKRGLDAYNVGHSPRSFEIAEFIESERRDAEHQVNDHLTDYRRQFEKLLSKLTRKSAESYLFQHDAEGFQRHIRELELILAEEEEG